MPTETAATEPRNFAYGNYARVKYRYDSTSRLRYGTASYFTEYGRIRRASPIPRYYPRSTFEGGCSPRAFILALIPPRWYPRKLRVVSTNFRVKLHENIACFGCSSLTSLRSFPPRKRVLKSTECLLGSRSLLPCKIVIRATPFDGGRREGRKQR